MSRLRSLEPWSLRSQGRQPSSELTPPLGRTPVACTYRPSRCRCHRSDSGHVDHVYPCCGGAVTAGMERQPRPERIVCAHVHPVSGITQQPEVLEEQPHTCPRTCGSGTLWRPYCSVDRGHRRCRPTAAGCLALRQRGRTGHDQHQLLKGAWTRFLKRAFGPGRKSQHSPKRSPRPSALAPTAPCMPQRGVRASMCRR